MSDFETRQVHELKGIGVEDPKHVALESMPEEHPPVVVPTAHGPVTTVVLGDLSNPTIVTFHDLGLEYRSCFQAFFNYPSIRAMLKVMSVVHITAPGQEQDAADLPGKKYPSMDELAEVVGEVADFHKVKRFVGFGVGAGANVMLRFALKNEKRVRALVLSGISTQAPGWHEWGLRKISQMQLAASGSMSQFTERLLLESYFCSKTLLENLDLVNTYRQHLSAHLNVHNFSLFQGSYNARRTVVPQLSPKFKPPILLLAGNDSWHLEQIEDMNGSMDRSTCEYMKVYHAADLIHEEHPNKVAEAFLLYLQGLGYGVGLTLELNSLSRTANK